MCVQHTQGFGINVAKKYNEELLELANAAHTKAARELEAKIKYEAGRVIEAARGEASNGNYYLDYYSPLCAETIQHLIDNGLKVTDERDGEAIHWHIDW